MGKHVDLMPIIAREITQARGRLFNRVVTSGIEFPVFRHLSVSVLLGECLALHERSKADVSAQAFAGGQLVSFGRAPITLKDGYPKEIVK
jgi:hypothetical protein